MIGCQLRQILIDKKGTFYRRALYNGPLAGQQAAKAASDSRLRPPVVFG